MINYILILFLIPVLTYANDHFQSYPSALSEAVGKIYLLKEARTLINQANKDGQIKLSIIDSKQFNFQGLWESSTRTIYVNESKHKSLGLTVQTIIFELHNALSSASFDKLWRSAKNGSISKADFIEKAEKIEYDNLIKSQTVIEKGVAGKIFPRETCLQIIPDFKLHYFYQQITGHSDWFAKQYDKNRPFSKKTAYHGTLKNLTTLSSEDKNDLVRYIRMCRKMNRENPADFFEPIEKEYQELQCCISGQAPESLNCKRAERRLELFQDVFKNFF